MFFESPRRLAACLRDAVEQLGGARRAVVCRELTKVHEEVVRGSLDELATWAADGVLGEITVVLAGATPRADLPSLVAQVEDLVADGVRVKDACGEVAAAHPGVRSRQLYDAVLQSRRDGAQPGTNQPTLRSRCTAARRWGCLMQAFRPFGVGIGVGGDPAADAQHGATRGVELDGADRDVQLASGRPEKPNRLCRNIFRDGSAPIAKSVGGHGVWVFR